MFGRKRGEFQCLKKRPEFQCLEGEALNSHVWKDKIRIEMLIKNTGGILLFGHRRSEFQCLQE